MIEFKVCNSNEEKYFVIFFLIIHFKLNINRNITSIETAFWELPNLNIYQLLKYS